MQRRTFLQLMTAVTAAFTFLPTIQQDETIEIPVEPKPIIVEPGRKVIGTMYMFGQEVGIYNAFIDIHQPLREMEEIEFGSSWRRYEPIGIREVNININLVSPLRLDNNMDFVIKTNSNNRRGMMYTGRADECWLSEDNVYITSIVSPNHHQFLVEPI